MADPTIPAAPEAAPTYRPLAPLAVAALAVSGLFAVLTLVMGGVALVSRKPIIAPWVVIVGVAGLTLSVIARVQIRRSEHTRAGLRLANVGWWLAVVFLVLYGPYLLVSDFVVKQESLKATDEWLDALKSGDESGLYTAFVRTLEPAQQRDRNINPSDRQGMEDRFGAALTGFRQNEFVRAVRESRGELKVESAAVANWEYDKGVYHVTQSLEVRTPEGAFEAALSATGSEDKQGNRVWKIQPLGGPNVIRRRQLTGFGRLRLEVKIDGERTAKEWIRRMYDRSYEAGALGRLPPGQRDPLRRQALVRSVTALSLEPLGAAGFPTGALLFAPPVVDQAVPGLGLGAFVAGDWVRIEPPTQELKVTPAIMEVLMGQGGMGPAGSAMEGEVPNALSETDRGVQFHLPVDTGITLPTTPPRSRPRGHITFELLDGDVVDQLRQLRAEGLGAKFLPDTAPPLLQGRRLDWRLVGMVIFNSDTPTTMKFTSGGSGSGGGGGG